MPVQYPSNDKMPEKKAKVKGRGIIVPAVAVNLPFDQSTDKLPLLRQSLLSRQPEGLDREGTAHPHTQASHGGSALLRYRADNNLHRLRHTPCRLFFLTLLKSPDTFLLTDLESGNKANSSSGFPAGFAPRYPAAPQISAFFSPINILYPTTLLSTSNHKCRR
jgi:hypothetical protein